MNKAITFDGYGLKTETWDKASYGFINSHVGGYIERVPNKLLEERNIDLWCNEEGKLNNNLSPTLALSNNGNLYDILMGNLVFTKCDIDGETISLTDDDIEYIYNLFDKLPLTITSWGETLKTLPYGKE